MKPISCNPTIARQSRRVRWIGRQLWRFGARRSRRRTFFDHFVTQSGELIAARICHIDKRGRCGDQNIESQSWSRFAPITNFASCRVRSFVGGQARAG